MRETAKDLYMYRIIAPRDRVMPRLRHKYGRELWRTLLCAVLTLSQIERAGGKRI